MPLITTNILHNLCYRLKPPPPSSLSPLSPSLPTFLSPPSSSPTFPSSPPTFLSLSPPLSSPAHRPKIGSNAVESHY